MSINGYSPGGYANKLYSVISSLVVALLTDSAVIIRWEYINELIEEPVDSAFATFDSENDFNACYMNETIKWITARQSWEKNKTLNTFIDTYIPTKRRRFLYKSYDPYFFEICSNPIYYEKLKYYQLVSAETINNALTKLMTTPHSATMTSLTAFYRLAMKWGATY